MRADEAVVGFVQGRNRSDLDSDLMLLFAAVRGIEVIGEAAGRVSEETRNAQPGVPWNAIIGMRNRLIHGYFDIDKTVVWKTATSEIPTLLRNLKSILAESGG